MARGSYQPLWTPGGARSTIRRAQPPTLVTPQLANGSAFFDDFLNTSIDFPSTYGIRQWELYQTAGLGYIGSAAAAGSSGVVTLACAGAGTTLLVEGSVSTTGVTQPGNFKIDTALKSVGQFRLSWQGGVNTFCNTGFGWINPSHTARGVDWITDPDTTLAGGTHVVFTRHDGAYGGAAAREVWCRVYDVLGVFNTAFRVSAAAWTAQSNVECLFSGAAKTLSVYLNGVLIQTVPLTGLVSSVYPYAAWAQQSTGAGTRILIVDSYFQELENSAPR